MSLGFSRNDAWQLLCEFTQGESLRKHALAVEAAMRWYAQHFGEDEELWAITGLLHDMDYERYPDANENGHPYVGCEVLRGKNYPPEVIEAIMGHAHYTGVPRTSLLARTLFACDELSGLITAAVLVRPDKSIHELKLKSVKKKIKDKAFARAVSREDIILGAQELEIDLDVHIENVIKGLAAAAVELGLSGE